MGVEVRLNGVDRFLEGMAGRLKHLTPALQDAGLRMVSITVDRIKKGVPPPDAPLTVRAKGGDRTLMDTGRLVSSITYRVQGNQLSWGTDVMYAAVHQFGATISAKRAKKLAIPATQRMRRASSRTGVRATLEKLRASGWRIWFTKGAIMGQQGRKSPEVLFVRKESVNIPKREFLKFGNEEETALYHALLDYIFGGA